MQADRLFDVSGRVVLITGPSGGIGQALSEGLAERGAVVVLNGRRAEALEVQRERLAARGLSVEAAAFDVTKPEALQEGVAAIERSIGPIDVVINNAGIQHRQPLEEFAVDQWDAMLRTNVSSAFYVGQMVARHMIARRRGKIINIASVQSELARPGIAPYTATKGAIRNLTRGMCTDWVMACRSMRLRPAISVRR